MRFSRTLTTTSVLALLAGPALADLTAEDVLADQLNQMSMYGLKAEVTGQSRSGDTLSVESLVATADIPDGNFTMTVGGAHFTEQGDGTVLMTYPATLPISLQGSGPEGEEFEMEMSITQVGTESIVSGSPDRIRYDFTSEQFTLGGLRFLAPEEAAEANIDMNVTASGISGMMELGGGEVRDYTADFTINALSMLMNASNLDGDEGSFSLDLSSQDLKAAYKGAMAAQDLMTSFATAIQNGNVADGTASFGPTTYTLAGDSPEGSFETAVAVGSGDVAFKMDATGLDYGGTNRDITASVGGSAIPFPPMTFKLAESGGRFAMPIVPGDEPQDFAMRIGLVGLEVDPMLWGMFDPTEQIPRDPASVIVDVDGEVILTEDIFDPAFAEQEMTAPPGQINALNVNEVRLSFGGAELTGDGDFTFNNDMGMPLPAGVMNMMLVGGNGLLDTLVGMGLVPEEQAMGARMMMGLFARPGEGEDTLVSTIEVMEDGSVLANGQRIK